MRRLISSDLWETHPDDDTELFDVLGYEIARNGLDYDDTYRATPEELGIEHHLKKQSCCGIYETKHTCKSGRTYYLGCNYGH